MSEESPKEQKTHPEALQDFQEKYHIISEMLPLGMFRLGPGPDYRFVSANRKLLQMLGYESVDSLKGTSAQDLVINPAVWQQIEADLVKEGSVTGRELQVMQKDGSEILVALNAWVGSDTERQITWIEGFVEDVTERKELELEMHYHESELSRYALALTQVNKKLKPASSITRHDILNQLTALWGYLELMDGDTRDPKIKKYIELEKSIAETIRKQIQFTKDYHEIGV